MAERISPIQGIRPVDRVQAVGQTQRAAGQFGALRGIEVTPTLMGQLADSVERAQAKGATNILAFDATRAFIINVPHGRVITTMSQEEMEDNIFTNIDGAVLLK